MDTQHTMLPLTNVPFYERPFYYFRAAFFTGLFWIEMFSALSSMFLSISAFSHLEAWPIDYRATRFVLISYGVLQISTIFLVNPQRHWLRVIALVVSCAIWSGCSVVLLIGGAYAIGSITVALFIFSLINLVHLSRSHL